MTGIPEPGRHIALGILETFGQALEQERTSLGLTKTAFSRHIDVPVQSYCDWLEGKGDPSLFTIVAVCQRLGWEESALRTLFKPSKNPPARVESTTNPNL